MHGGLRYLANGENKLVREGLRERRHWARMAKHLVHPLAFVMPSYSGQKPSRLTLGLGLALYDWLAFDRNRGVDTMQKMPGYRAMTVAQTLGLIPDLPPQLAGEMKAQAPSCQPVCFIMTDKCCRPSAFVWRSSAAPRRPVRWPSIMPKRRIF